MANASEMLMKHDKGGPKASDELMGTGDAALTKKLRVECGGYNMKAQETGEKPMSWGEWLQPEYGLDKRGLAYRLK